MKQAPKALLLLLCLALLLCGCGTEAMPPESAPETLPAETPAPEPTMEASAPPAPSAEPARPVLRLWLSEDEALCDAFSALAEDYAAAQPEHALELRRFTTAAELNTALTGEQPDLLLCNERMAAQLPGALPEALPSLLFDAPEGFVPLGAELPVLALREENRALLEGCDTLEALCEAAASYGRQTGKPFFSADSFAQLFACALAQKGSPFFAMREQDLESEDYRTLYNLLAEAAFEGGLVPLNEPVLAAVSRGELVCGICSSRELLTGDRRELAVRPLPPMAGCEALTDAKLSGLAVLPGADAQAAADFLNWLLADGRAADAALISGLIPAADGTWREADAVTAGLAEAAQSARLWLPDEDSGYLRHGADFEQSFRAALALLG